MHAIESKKSFNKVSSLCLLSLWCSLKLGVNEAECCSIHSMANFNNHVVEFVSPEREMVCKELWFQSQRVRDTMTSKSRACKGLLLTNLRYSKHRSLSGRGRRWRGRRRRRRVLSWRRWKSYSAFHVSGSAKTLRRLSRWTRVQSRARKRWRRFHLERRQRAQKDLQSSEPRRLWRLWRFQSGSGNCENLPPNPWPVRDVKACPHGDRLRPFFGSWFRFAQPRLSSTRDHVDRDHVWQDPEMLRTEKSNWRAAR